MNKTSTLLASVVGSLLSASLVAAAPARPSSFYIEGETLYKAGRFSEATDAFEKAIKQKDRPADSQKYIDRIRKETVERIRNRALTGVSKSSWQTKYYYIRSVGPRIRVGISYQELYERQSLNFRQGAVEALVQLAEVLQKNDNAKVDIEMISEINLETPPNPDLLARQQAQLFSFLSLATQNLIPKY
jgi:tetratricopeptide (TPR) repeat protein